MNSVASLTDHPHITIAVYHGLNILHSERPKLFGGVGHSECNRLE